MGGGTSKHTPSTITIDTSNPSEQAHITIDGCFYNHPVAIILKSPTKKRVHTIPSTKSVSSKTMLQAVVK